MAKFPFFKTGSPKITSPTFVYSPPAQGGDGEGGGDTLQSEGDLIVSATAKTTPHDNDLLGISDSESSGILKKLSWANLKATLKTYFDALYTYFSGYSTTVSAAGTTALTASSNYRQYVTGTTTQTFTLPDVTTLALGREFLFQNNSTGVVTVNSSGGNAVCVIPAGGSCKITCVAITGTSASSWDLSKLIGGRGSNIILVDDAGNVRAVHNGTGWTFSTGTNTLGTEVVALNSFKVGASSNLYFLDYVGGLLGHFSTESVSKIRNGLALYQTQNGVKQNFIRTELVSYVNGTDYHSRLLGEIFTDDVKHEWLRVDSLPSDASVRLNANVGIGGAPTNFTNYRTLALNHTNGGVFEGQSGGSKVGYVQIDNSGVEVGADGARYVRFLTNGTERARIDSAGVLDLTSGQLKFPSTQNPSADANTLDDYEKGTFTPAIALGGGVTGITYSKQKGFYTKIGSDVFVKLYLVLTSKGSDTGALAFTGLPFTHSNVADSYSSGVIGFTKNVAFSGETRIYANLNSTTFNMDQGLEAGGSQVQLDDADISNDSEFIISLNYTTD